jgi:hypothetical protein
MKTRAHPFKREREKQLDLRKVRAEAAFFIGNDSPDADHGATCLPDAAAAVGQGLGSTSFQD